MGKERIHEVKARSVQKPCYSVSSMDMQVIG